MPYPHPIRLHGPWDYEPLVGGSPGRMKIPGDWGACLSLDYRGAVRLRRRFNSPTQLDAHERVWLVGDGIDPAGKVMLNGVPLCEVRGYALQIEADITSHLKVHNELTIDLADIAAPHLRPGRENSPGGILGEVRLEIRDRHQIAELSLHFERSGNASQAKLRGTVMGPPSPQGFEVAALGPAGEIVYAEVTASEPFELRGRAEGIPDWQLLNPANKDSSAHLAEIEVFLLRGGERIWESWFRTAVPPLPVPNMPVAAQIDERRLVESDSAGTPLIQSMPPQWADEVCSRLAHHPCIAAWGIPAGQPLPNSSQFGRPWIHTALS